MALISLASEVWTLLFDDLSSVIFTQFTVLPIYPGMCPSVLTHIYPYMSKPRLLLETDDEIVGYVYSGLPGTTAQDVLVLT